MRALQREHEAFFACDCRGAGESRPDTCRADSFFHSYGSDYHYASYALLLGESYIAWRVHDLLSVLDWMAQFRYDRIHLACSGAGCVPGALAALLDERVYRVTLIDAPASFEEMACNKLCSRPLSSMVSIQ